MNDRNLNCSSFTKFGYPEKFQDEGFFWTNKFDPSKAMKNIDYIYNLSEKEWKSMSNEIIKKIIVYDANNQFFQERLSQF